MIVYQAGLLNLLFVLKFGNEIQFVLQVVIKRCCKLNCMEIKEPTIGRNTAEKKVTQ